jgi:hypothetical protein
MGAGTFAASADGATAGKAASAKAAAMERMSFLHFDAMDFAVCLRCAFDGAVWPKRCSRAVANPLGSRHVFFTCSRRIAGNRAGTAMAFGSSLSGWLASVLTRKSVASAGP